LSNIERKKEIADTGKVCKTSNEGFGYDLDEICGRKPDGLGSCRMLDPVDIVLPIGHYLLKIISFYWKSVILEIINPKITIDGHRGFL